MTKTSPGASAATRVERPGSPREVSDLLRQTRGGVLFRGGGTKMSWGARPAAPDLVVETAGLTRLLTHNPADMTASVEAGMPLRTLQETLASSGQWLALDPPTESAGATIGGLLATGDSGPRRLRYGAARDLVIGVTLVLADGTVARSGGHVIKNVAGYDLSKLMYGSLGTLGLIAEVVLRVHPRPEASATFVVPANAATATEASLRLLASPLEPTAVDWVGDPGGSGRLAVRFEGSAAGVSAQGAALRQLPGVPHTAAGLLTEADEEALWREFAGAGAADPAHPGQTAASAGTLPSHLAAVARALAQAGDAAKVDVTLASHSALGLHRARFAGPVEGQARAFEEWRRAVLDLGGTVLPRERPEQVDDIVDAAGPPPSAVALLRALKNRLDPEGRCAAGRFGSWY